MNVALCLCLCVAARLRGVGGLWHLRPFSQKGLLTPFFLAAMSPSPTSLPLDLWATYMGLSYSYVHEYMTVEQWSLHGQTLLEVMTHVYRVKLILLCGKVRCRVLVGAAGYRSGLLSTQDILEPLSLQYLGTCRELGERVTRHERIWVRQSKCL